MEPVEVLLQYMRSCIRANSPIDLDKWDAETLRSVFHTLPRTSAGFEEWVTRMSPKAQTPKPNELSEEAMREQNSRFVAACEDGTVGNVLKNG